jgi:hypothetical protein
LSAGMSELRTSSMSSCCSCCCCSAGSLKF